MSLKKIVLPVLLSWHMLAFSQPSLQSPEQFLGYPQGGRYTPHHRIVEYFRHAAEAVPGKLRLQSYGKTYEGRPLMLAFVSSPANLARLEQIRMNNLRLAGLSKDREAATSDLPVIVWLSYNVHGNEPSSSEAAMKTLHRLVEGSDPATAGWLEKAVVVMDPCINPDGRDRYANWQNGMAGVQPDVNPQSREHREPWPGGRVNHYYFDLNRDWAWQTQTESRQRMQVYNEWLPQVHVDFHEQGITEPYYFAPAAEPYHELITPWQREFQQMVGRNNASRFDSKGWLYFTRERFDLFYPSYGDTYPTYNGAIGMTYEQGGGPRGGRAVVIEDGDTLTLADRIEHHYTTGLSTIEVSVREADRLKREFRKFFSDGMADPGPSAARYYIVRSKPSMGNDGGTLGKYLRNNAISYGYAQTKLTAKGFGYITGREEAFTVNPNDIVIPARQPKATMLKVLFEPESRLSDSATYDITAWSLPYAMGLDAYMVRDIPSLGALADKPSTVRVQPGAVNTADVYAYVIPWTGFGSAQLLSGLLKAGMKVRFAEQPFESGGRLFGKGSLIVTRAANNMTADALFSKLTKSVAESPDFHEGITPLSSGLVDKGFDLGSRNVKYIRAPRVALLAGEGLVNNAVGEIWHLFDQQLHYPLSLINLTDLPALDWKSFDVIIMPDGNYRTLADKSVSEELRNWVRQGGRLIALENAVASLASTDWAIRPKKQETGKDEEKNEYAALKRYEDREKEYLKGSIPGAVYRVELDNSHPLAFGYPSQYYTLRQDAAMYEFMKEGGWNVGVLKKNSYVTGFAGVKAKERLKDGVVLGVQEIGRGTVVYFADDPIFRGFWENGKLLLSNAVFLVGQ